MGKNAARNFESVSNITATGQRVESELQLSETDSDTEVALNEDAGSETSWYSPSQSDDCNDDDLSPAISKKIPAIQNVRVIVVFALHKLNISNMLEQF